MATAPTITQLPLLAIPQQPAPQFDVTGPMDRFTFERLVSRARRILETCEPGRAWEELKALGLGHDNNGHTFGRDEVIWEHERITRHNKACGPKGILSQGFYTLYAEVVEHQPYRSIATGEQLWGAHTSGHVEFIRGRVGNTVALQLEVKIEERN